MKQIKNLIIFTILPILFISCSKRNEIKKQNIENYIKAYNNIVKVYPRLNTKIKDSNVHVLYLCKECYPILDNAVKDAGFKDLEEFQMFDIKIHIIIDHIYKLSLAELTGKEVYDIDSKEVCREIYKISISKEKSQIIQEKCKGTKTYSGYLQKTSSFTTIIAGKLLDIEKIKLVKKNLKRIEEALLNKDLPEGLKHTRGVRDD